MHKVAATRNTRAIFLAASISILAGLPLSAKAQQPGPAIAGALIRGAAGAAIGEEGQLKATILVFQDGKPAAEYHYYWWRGGCYVRYQSDNNYQSVQPDACS